MRAWMVFSSIVVAAPVAAQTTAETAVHPLYAEMPGSMRNEEARRQFAAAVARQGLGPVQVMDIAGPAPPRGPEALKAARPATEKLRFAEAEGALDQAVSEVEQQGPVGFSEGELADLFLYQAIAAQKATWKELDGPVGDIAPAKAKQAYLRAAVLAPARVLEAHHHPPLAIASFARAAAEVNARPRGTLVVRASATALITIDGRPWQSSPATAAAVPYGEHFVRVEDVGHQPWASVVTLAAPTQEVPAPPMPGLVPDAGEAAAHARRMGARFALLAALRLDETPVVTVDLVDAGTGARVDSATVPLGGDPGALLATVAHLCDEATQPVTPIAEAPRAVPPPVAAAPAVPAATPADAEPSLADNPRAWARKNWPVLTVVGVFLGTALVMSLAVAEPHPPR